LALAITAWPAAAAAGTSATKELVAVMQGLRPAVAHVPMSIKHMNFKLLMPKMNFDTDMMHTGDLQVVPATHVICDETAMEDGQLDEKGLKNLHCLQQLATFQHILFDFNYDWMKFPTDAPVLVMSQGRAKPLLKTDVVVQLKPDAAAAAQACAQDESPEAQELCRVFMGLARALDVGVSNEVEQMVPNTFVEARKANPKVQQEDLHCWMTLAKLLAASHGSDQVKKEHWELAMRMEDERARRLAV
jgi:hypothetical protein